MIFRFSLPALPRSAAAAATVAALALLAFAVPASRAEADVITFNNLTAPNGSPFTTYTEGLFTVTALTGSVNVAQFYGNPVPDIYGSGTYSVQVVRTDGGNFTFSSADLAYGSSGGSTTFSFAGFAGQNQVLSQSGSVGSSFTTIGSSNTSSALDRLVIGYSNSGTTTSNIDNITVNPAAVGAPEPGSFPLLGMGLVTGLGIVGPVRRSRNRKANG